MQIELTELGTDKPITLQSEDIEVYRASGVDVEYTWLQTKEGTEYRVKEVFDVVDEMIDPISQYNEETKKRINELRQKRLK